MSNKTNEKAHRCQCQECQHYPRGKTAKLHRGLNNLVASLDEKHRRMVAGLWSLQLGRGGIQRIADITGLSRPTIARGQREAMLGSARSTQRLRQPGGGRLRVEKNSPVSWPPSQNC